MESLPFPVYHRKQIQVKTQLRLLLQIVDKFIDFVEFQEKRFVRQIVHFAKEHVSSLENTDQTLEVLNINILCLVNLCLRIGQYINNNRAKHGMWVHPEPLDTITVPGLNENLISQNFLNIQSELVRNQDLSPQFLPGHQTVLGLNDNRTEPGPSDFQTVPALRTFPTVAHPNGYQSLQCQLVPVTSGYQIVPNSNGSQNVLSSSHLQTALNPNYFRLSLSPSDHQAVLSGLQIVRNRPRRQSVPRRNRRRSAARRGRGRSVPGSSYDQSAPGPSGVQSQQGPSRFAYIYDTSDMSEED